MDKPIFEKMFGFSQEYPLVGRLSAWFAIFVAKLYYIAFFSGAVILFINRDMKILIYVLFPAMTLLTSHTFRQVIKRQRPYEEYPIKPYVSVNRRLYSMPSNHSASSMIIGLAFLYINMLAGALLIVGAVFTGLSRVLAGIHYPFDVCVGWLLALIYGTVMLYILL